MDRELALQFRLSARPHRVEQSRPTRNSGAAQQSCHLGAYIRVLPAHRRISGGSILRCGDQVFAFIAEDLKRFIEDRSKLRENRATANATPS